MVKIVSKYFAALVLALLVWNFLIGSFYMNRTVTVKNYVIGSSYVPGSKTVSAGEGFSIYRNDEMGFNNDSISQIRNEKLRILVLGDSFTEAKQVFRSFNFVKLLEQKLDTDGDRYEVFNLGRNGRTIPDHVAYAEGYKSTFSSDYVVIQAGANAFGEGVFLDSGKENKVIEEDGEYKVVKTDFYHDDVGVKKWLKNNFDIPIVLAGLNKMRQFSIFNKTEDETNLATNSSTETLQEVKNDRLTDFLISELAEKYGNKFVLLYIPDFYSIKNGQVIFNDTKDINVVKEICQKYNVKIIDPTAKFVRLYEEKKKLPQGFNNSSPLGGHLNKDGHKIVADLLYDFFLI